MNDDSAYIRLRELSWRRPLTESEQVELRALLAARPDVIAEWESEAELNALWASLPNAPMPSNFTARVLQSIQREAVAEAREHTRLGRWWTRMFVPRAAVAAAVVACGLFGYYLHIRAQREAQVATIRELVAISAQLPGPQALEDFDAIRSLKRSPGADEELLALMK
jgi:hypothetical protein